MSGVIRKAGPFKLCARKYFEMGLAPIPLAPRTKAPAVQGWNQVHEGYPKEVFEAWMADVRLEDAGLGLAPGTRHGDWRLVAIDVDQDALVPHVLAALADFPREAALCAKKGRKGLTIFALAPLDVRSERLLWKAGEEGLDDETEDEIKLLEPGKMAIEVLAARTHTVLPPSIHPDTGRPYEWAGRPFDDIVLTDLPKFLPHAASEIRALSSRHEGRKLRALQTMVWAGVGEGGSTHETCLRAAGKLVQLGWKDADIHARIERAKRQACTRAGEPYDWPESTKTIQEWIDSARKKAFDAGATAPGEKRVPAERLLAEWALGALGGPDAVALWDGSLRRYQDGAWASVDEAGLEAQLRSIFLFDRSATLRQAKNAMEILRSLAHRDRPPGPAGSRICLQNGTLNLETGELERWAPEHGVRHRLTFAWDAGGGSGCPLYDAAVRRTFEGDEGRVRLWDEFCAHTLVPELRHKKMLMLIGPTDTGKSTLVRVLQGMHDPAALSAASLAGLEKDVDLWPLVGKLLNVSSEQTRLRDISDDIIKAVTGEDTVQARQLYRQAVRVRLTCRFLIMANDTPSTADASNAVLNRIMILKTGASIPKDEQDPDLTEKLLHERPGILRRWAEAYRGLRARGRFEEPEAVLRAREEYRLEQDLVALWLSERCESTEEAAPSGELYEDFRQWLMANGHRAISSVTWGKRLTALGHGPENMRHGMGRTAPVVKGRRVRVRPGMESRL